VTEAASQPSTERIVAAARAQKLLILSVLLNLLSFFLLQPRSGAFVNLPSLSLQQQATNPMVVLIYSVAALFQIVCIYRMAKAIGDSGTLYAALTWIPLLGGLVLLHLNGRTNQFLKAAGLHVGFFGVRGEEIDARAATIAGQA
jgi:Na+/melibiose symporter-like transporter